MSTAPNRQFTVEEYLAREERSELKHEYYRGEIFAMSGGSRNHSKITGNVYFQLRVALKGGPCRPSNSDQRIFIPKVGLHTYPDLSVVCGAPASESIDPNANTNPTLLVEVLSPSTELYDRRQKFDFYKRISTLKEYVLVAQDEPRIERYVRGENGGWTLFTTVGINSEINFDSIGCTMRLADVYESVEFAEVEPTLIVEPPPTAESRRPHE
ncbi:Uma2 family endonuclease [Anatilimnocola sp. NA78]|uniref:Uma2 family endonuclease n=1 Tax=Anatilimnocola sp. NA78 TaxID=3415683 RepID=UPI003CE5BE9F